MTLTSLLADGLRLRLAADGAVEEPPTLPQSPAGGGLHASIDPSRTSALLDAADRADP